MEISINAKVASNYCNASHVIFVQIQGKSSVLILKNIWSFATSYDC